MSNFIVYNGQFLSADKPLFTADNRSFRYGDGIFETMKLYQQKILLADLHFERLLASMRLMRFEAPSYYTPDYFSGLIRELCQKNNVSRLARIRLTVFRADGGLYDPENHFPHFLIQAWELRKSIFELNSSGLVIDVYPDAQKSCDKLANLKSNNCLPYIMAAMHAKEQRLNDCLLLNAKKRVADATIANVFVVKGKTIFTPPLTEGAVCGVMRKALLGLESNFSIKEKPLTIEELEEADEVFLTNAIYGIRWVGRFRETAYGNYTSQILHELLHESWL